MVKFVDNSSENFMAYFSRVPNTGDFIAPSSQFGEYPCCRVIKVFHYPFKGENTDGLIAGLVEVEAVVSQLK